MPIHFDDKDRAEALFLHSEGISANGIVDIMNLGRKKYVILPVWWLNFVWHRIGKREVNIRWVFRVIKTSKQPPKPKSKGGRPRKLTPQQARQLHRCGVG